MKVISKYKKVEFVEILSNYRSYFGAINFFLHLIFIGLFGLAIYFFLSGIENSLAKGVKYLGLIIGAVYLFFLSRPLVPYFITPVVIFILEVISIALNFIAAVFEGFSDVLVKSEYKLPPVIKFQPREVFDLIIRGKSIDEIVLSNPGISKAHVIECIEYAENLIGEMDINEIYEKNNILNNSLDLVEKTRRASRIK